MTATRAHLCTFPTSLTENAVLLPNQLGPATARCSHRPRWPSTKRPPRHGTQTGTASSRKWRSLEFVSGLSTRSMPPCLTAYLTSTPLPRRSQRLNPKAAKARSSDKTSLSASLKKTRRRRQSSYSQQNATIQTREDQLLRIRCVKRIRISGSLARVQGTRKGKEFYLHKAKMGGKLLAATWWVVILMSAMQCLPIGLLTEHSLILQC